MSMTKSKCIVLSFVLGIFMMNYTAAETPATKTSFAGKALITSDLRGNVLVVVDRFQGTDQKEDGIADSMFVFTPKVPLPTKMELVVARANISYGSQGILQVSTKEGTILDLAVSKVGKKDRIPLHDGYGMAWYRGDFGMSIENVAAKAMDGSFGVRLDEDVCKDCESGGQGSDGCGVSGCKGTPPDCTVSCQPGTWSCCKCLADGKASCKCCSPLPEMKKVP